MSKITVIVGQSGKTQEINRRTVELWQQNVHVMLFDSWKSREDYYLSCNADTVLAFDDFDAGLDHRIMKDVVQQLIRDSKGARIYLVVYTLDMIDTLLNLIPHEDLTFVRVQADGSCFSASAQDVAIIRERWGGDIR